MENKSWHTRPEGRAAVRVGLFLAGLLLGAAIEQVAVLDALPPQVVVALRALAAALSGS